MVKAEIRASIDMKDSGIAWVGKIPKHCGMTQIKRFFHVQAGGDAKPEYYAYEKDEVHKYPVYTNSANKNQIYAYTSKPIFDKGTITVAGRGTLGVAFLRDTPYDAIIRLLSVSARDNSKVVPKFWEYWFNATNVTLDIQTTVGQLSAKQFEVKPAIVMPVEEQQAIAAYLDKVCGTIDEIMAEAKDSIEEYKQLKQSVIFEAVTKGLDKDVEMKDSGVEWIGEIPKHWSLAKSNRFITSTQNGISRRDLEKSTGTIVLKLRNITEIGEIDYSDTNRIELSDKEIENYILQVGDLLFVRVNGSKSLVGKCAIFYGADEAVAYNDHIIRVQVNKFCSGEYFKWYLLSQSGKAEIALHINTAAGQYTISGQGLKDIHVPLPPKNEQEKIISFLERKCKQCDALISEKQSLIADLAAYKKSLIYELVTGKRRVV